VCCGERAVGLGAMEVLVLVLVCGSMPIVDQGEAFVRKAALMELAAVEDDDAVEAVVLILLLLLLLLLLLFVLLLMLLVAVEVDEEEAFTAVLGL
jgi:hypothetical protein